MIGLLLALLLVASTAWAGDVASIGVQASTTHPWLVPGPAEDYWNRYPDVAADSYYGRSRPTGAREHYDCCGRLEGRTWNEPGSLITGSADNIGILRYCGDRGTGGHNCLRFPQGARLSAISWQSSVKAANSEVLVLLVLDGLTGRKIVMNAHHLEVSARTKSITLADPIDIPPNGSLWVFAEGWSDPHFAGLEVQATFFFIGNNVAVLTP